jgi:hypothetical protein
VGNQEGLRPYPIEQRKYHKIVRQPKKYGFTIPNAVRNLNFRSQIAIHKRDASLHSAKNSIKFGNKKRDYPFSENLRENSLQNEGLGRG